MGKDTPVLDIEIEIVPPVQVSDDSSVIVVLTDPATSDDGSVIAVLTDNPATFAARFEGPGRPCVVTGNDTGWGTDTARDDDGGGCDDDGDSLSEGWKIAVLRERFGSISKHADLNYDADGTSRQGRSTPSSSIGESELGTSSSSTGPPPHVLFCARRHAAATAGAVDNDEAGFSDDEAGFSDEGDDDKQEFLTDVQLVLIKSEEGEAEAVRGCHADDKPTTPDFDDDAREDFFIPVAPLHSPIQAVVNRCRRDVPRVDRGRRTPHAVKRSASTVGVSRDGARLFW